MWITGQGGGFGLRPKQRFAEYVVGIYDVWIARSRRAEGAAVGIDAGLTDAQQNTDAALSSSIMLRSLLAIVSLLLGIAFASLIGGSIAGPLSGMTAVMRRLAGGEVSIGIPAQDCAGEIGEMAKGGRRVQAAHDRGRPACRRAGCRA